jgi:hypothetical protein
VLLRTREEIESRARQSWEKRRRAAAQLLAPGLRFTARTLGGRPVIQKSYIRMQP